MAFGENGPRKKTAFEKLTLVVVILMVLVTVGGLIATAIWVQLFKRTLKRRFFFYALTHQTLKQFLQ